MIIHLFLEKVLHKSVLKDLAGAQMQLYPFIAMGSTASSKIGKND